MVIRSSVMIIRSSVMIMRSSVRGVTTLRNELTDFLFLIRIITRHHYAITPITRLLRAYYVRYKPNTRLLRVLRLLRACYGCYAPITRVTNLLRAYYAPITHLLRIYFFCYAGTLRRSVTTRNFDTETRNEA